MSGQAAPAGLGPATRARTPFRSEESVLRIDGLRVAFPGPDGTESDVVRNVSLSVNRGQTLAVVGESGSGKTQTFLATLGLVPHPGRVTGGRVVFDGRDLLTLPAEELRQVRGAGIAMVFQDPLTALNPVVTVGAQIAHAIRAHRQVGRRAARAMAAAALDEVGIPNAAARLRDYPHQFSGGQRQRVLIAMALALEPEVLLADEPTTALDVTVQAQILELLTGLRESRQLAMVLVTHDLGLVAEHADQVAIMYCGDVVEYATVDDVFDRPRHPYTRRLLGCAPSSDVPRGAVLQTIPGTPPTPADRPPGCSFEPRCDLGRGRGACRERTPELVSQSVDHVAACHFAGDLPAADSTADDAGPRPGTVPA